MLPLAVSIIASTLFSLTIKAAHRRGCTLLAVGATNYLTAAVVYLVASVVTLLLPGGRVPSPRSVLMGMGTGVLFVVAFVLIAALQERKGISITTAALRLSVLFPVLASLLLWGEKARGLELAGMALAVVSLPLLGFAGSGPGVGRAPEGSAVGRATPRADLVGLLITAGLFVANGLVGVAVRLYHQVGAARERVYFFASLFLTAAGLSRLVLAATRRRVARSDLLPGVLLGIWNTGGSFLLLVALATLPGFVAFPLQSALALLLTTLAAVLIWHERFSPAGAAGIGLAVVSAVLLNL